ncbi:LYR motif-containing protein 4-like [Patiria miniata]|uniref:Complex 1 LYR protein domain-containing protein n=1 Tax=Patiria miniata TaxID=46514 RepID=A0A914B299_PATMI|nr:LYR motif-containing protein 4-like [Patiria miniata]
MAATMANATRATVLKLYREILRESKKFTGYNYREYALRRTKVAFRENKSLTDEAKIKALIQEAEENLQIIKRQVVLSQLYKDPSLVIEGENAGQR